MLTEKTQRQSITALAAQAEDLLNDVKFAQRMGQDAEFVQDRMSAAAGYLEAITEIVTHLQGTAVPASNQDDNQHQDDSPHPDGEAGAGEQSKTFDHIFETIFGPRPNQTTNEGEDSP